MSLTGLAVVLQLKPSLLFEMCQEYWRDHCHLNSCFQDLRRYIESMSAEHQRDFHQFMSESVKSSKPGPENTDYVGHGSCTTVDRLLTQFAELTQEVASDRVKRPQV